MSPQCPTNCLTVVLDKKYQDAITTKSGVLLYRDTYFKPEWTASNTGKVVATPKRITQTYDRKNLVLEAQVGDEVIFSYLVVHDRKQPDPFTTIYHNEFEIDGIPYWKVDYRLVLGYIRNGKIIPSSGYVFLDVIKEVKEGVSPGGIILPEMSRTKVIESEGTVTHIGMPDKDAPTLSIKVGDKVAFDKRFVEKYEIQGKEMLVLRQERVLAKI